MWCNTRHCGVLTKVLLWWSVLPQFHIMHQLLWYVHCIHYSANIWMTQLANFMHCCSILPTNTCVIITVQLITILAGALIGSINVITCLCTSTIISQAFINIYNNNIQLQMTTSYSVNLHKLVIKLAHGQDHLSIHVPSKYILVQVDV